jgi:hypothetical protein
MKLPDSAKSCKHVEAMTDTRKDTLTRAIKKQQTIFLTHLLRWLPVSAIMGIT